MTLPKPARPDPASTKQIWVNYLAAYGIPVETARLFTKAEMLSWKPGDGVPDRLREMGQPPKPDPEPPVQKVDTSPEPDPEQPAEPVDEDNTEDDGSQYRQMEGTGTEADTDDTITLSLEEYARLIDDQPLLPPTIDRDQESYPWNIQDAILKVMDVVGAIGKNEMNRTPGASYNFRGVDTVVNAVQPAFLMFGVTISPRCLVANTSRAPKDTNNGNPLLWADVLMEYTLTARDGSSRTWTAPGAAMDSGDKAIGKACSVAYRIAMLQGLCIPTHDPDPDSVSYGADDEGYQTHGRGNQSRGQQNGGQRPAQGQQRGPGPDYTAPRPTNAEADQVRAYTLQVMEEFEKTPGKRWTGPDIIKAYWDLYKVDYRQETDVDRMKSFGRQLRDDAIQDRAMEEQRAVENVLSGLGGEVIESPDGDVMPDESEPVDAEVVSDDSA